MGNLFIQRYIVRLNTVHAMKKVSLCVILCLLFLNANSQRSFKVYNQYNIPELSLSFEMGHRLIEAKDMVSDGKGKLYYEEPGITKENMTKSDPVNMIIRINGPTENDSRDIELPYNDIDIDLSGFPIHYVGVRKFLVIRVGRYRFYILNLSNFNVVGPQYAGVSGEASDSQDGSLSFLEVFNNGQYLIGYAWGFGIFCYNLMDLYYPELVDHICTEEYHNHQNYVFLDHQIDNVYVGIAIKNHSYRDYNPAEFLFQGLMLETDEKVQPIKRIIDDQFLMLNRIKDDGSVIPFRVDFIKGVNCK